MRNLLGVVDRELADASVAGLSDDGRFTHAYDAALLLCKLALHASGFEVQKRVRMGGSVASHEIRNSF